MSNSIITFFGGAESYTITFFGGDDGVCEVKFEEATSVLTGTYPVVNISDPTLVQRVIDLEESTDGLVSGVEPLQYYILARDN